MKKSLIFLLIIVMLLAACGGNSLSNNQGEANTELVNGEMIFENEEIEMDEVEEIEDVGIDLPIQDACLIGTWEVDDASLIEYLSKNMNISDEIQIVPQVTSGRLLWIFDENNIMFMESPEPLEITVDIIANGTNLASSIINLTASGEAMYENFSGFVYTSATDYNIESDGSLQLNANEMINGSATVNLTPHNFTARINEIGEEIILPVEAFASDYNGAFAYLCDADNALLTILLLRNMTGDTLIFHKTFP